MGRRARRRRTEGAQFDTDAPRVSSGRSGSEDTRAVLPERSGPVIAIGAPVAERAWILPRWFECLAAQTLQPTYLCFTYSDSEDNTFAELTNGANSMPSVKFLGGLRVNRTKLPYHSRDDRSGDPADPWRAEHMAKLRNELRAQFLATDADVFVSLDTDILLEDPTILEQLIGTLYGPRAENPRAEWGWDVAAACTSLHAVSEHCYNAAWWRAGDRGDFRRIWQRADENTVMMHQGKTSALQIHIPMAVFAIHRFAMHQVRYKTHEQGEDLGFADNLDQKGLRVGWRPDLRCRHVWDPGFLEPA